MNSSSRGTGMVLGKFLPPHLGHQYLVNFARHYVEELTVLACSLASEPIPGELRYQWMCELCPDCRVIHVRDENPQEPHEDPDFWQIWHETIRRVLPEGPDYFFASEDYGFKLAEILYPMMDSNDNRLSKMQSKMKGPGGGGTSGDQQEEDSGKKKEKQSDNKKDKDKKTNFHYVKLFYLNYGYYYFKKLYIIRSFKQI